MDNIRVNASGQATSVQQGLSFEEVYQACKGGKWQFVREALPRIKGLADSRGNSIFHVFIREGNEDVIRELLDRKLAKPLSNGHFDRSLHLAAKYGWPRIIIYLPKWLGINSIIDGMTPLHVAIREDQRISVATLIRNGASLKIVGDLALTPVEYAVKKGRVNCLHALINGGIDLSKHVPGIGTLLHLALISGKQEIFEYLLSRKRINLESRNDKQQTPLILAAALGNSEAVYLLHKYGAKINARDEMERTALHWACINLHRHTVETLHRLAASLTIIDREGYTPVGLLKNNQDFTGKGIYNFLNNLSSNHKLSKPDFCFRPPHNLAFGGGVQNSTFSALAELQRTGKLVEVVRVSCTGEGIWPAILYALGYHPCEMTALWKQNLDILILKATKKQNCTLGDLAKLVRPKRFKHLHFFVQQQGKYRRFTTENTSDHDLVISALAQACLASGQLIAKRKDGTCVKQNEMGTFKKTNQFPIDAFDEHRYVFEGSESAAPLYNRQTLGFYPSQKFAFLKTYNRDRVLEFPTTPHPRALENIGVKVVKTFFCDMRGLLRTPFCLPAIEGPSESITELHPSDSDFIGREEYLESLEKALIDGWKESGKQLRLRVLCGPGGVGKSEIACKFANQYRDSFSHVYWISGDEIQREKEFRDLFSRLYRNSRTKTPSDPAVIRKKVYEALELMSLEHPFLLIFDDLEEPKKKVETSFPFPRRNGCVLVTCQNASCYASKETMPVKPFLENEAKDFISEITQDDDVKSIGQLVKILGGSPLVLANAANHIRRKGRIAEYLKNPDIQDLLTKGSLRHKQSLAVTLKITMSSLEPLAQEWLTLCAYFAPDKIPESWIKSWLEHRQKNPDEGLTILNSLRDSQLIQHGASRSFSLNRFLQHALRMFDANKSWTQAFFLLVKRARGFTAENIEMQSEDAFFLSHAKAVFSYNLHQEVDQKDLASLYSAMGVADHQRAHYSKALEYHKRALAIREKIYGETHVEVALSRNEIALALSQLGKFKEAMSFYKDALSACKNRPWQVVIVANFGALAEKLGEFEAAMQCFKNGLALGEEWYGKRHPRVAVLSTGLGCALSQLGQFREAMGYHNKALAIAKQLYGAESCLVATVVNNIGGVWGKLGIHDKALVCSITALNIWKRLNGNEHQLARLRNSIGSSLRNLGKYDEALKHHKQALAISKRILGAKHPEVAFSLSSIGGCLLSLGRYNEALTRLKQALNLLTEIYGVEHHEVGNVLNAIGVVLHQVGRHKDAYVTHKRALDICEKVYGKEHPESVGCLVSVGVALSALRKFEDAVALLRQAKGIIRSFAPEHPDLARALNGIGIIYFHQGKYDEALKYQNQALNINKKLYDAAHPSIAASNSLISATLYSRGNLELALKYSKLALNIYRRTFDDRHPNVIKTQKFIETVEGEKKQSRWRLAGRILLRVLPLGLAAIAWIKRPRK